MRALKLLLSSKRFQAAVASVVVVVLNERLGWDIDAETINSGLALVIAWIVGDSIAATDPEKRRRILDRFRRESQANV